jgi:hypothetical protein
MARAGGMNVSAPLIGSISVRDDADMIALQEQIRQLPARLNEEWGQSWESITRSGYRRSPSHG